MKRDQPRVPVFKWRLILPLALLLTLHFPLSTLFAQGTAFSYQGRLTDGIAAANGAYEFRFALYDAPGSGAQIGSAVTNTAVANAGSFTVTLDFGASAFPGANRWLQIGVRTNGSTGVFTPLTPRQPLSPAPYAITAGDVTGPNIARLDVPNTSVEATAVPTVSFGFVVNATLTGGGSGYTTPPTVTVNDATGSGAVIAASISGGAVVGLTVQNPGGGYSAGATLTIAVPPSNAFQSFASRNFFTGANAFSNPANTFAGNGSALTGISGVSLVTGSISNPLIADGAVSAGKIAGGQVVKSFNGLSDAVTLTAGTNITLTPSGNNLLIAANVSGGLTWQMVSGTAQQAQPNTGYCLTNNGPVRVTLPTSPNPGEFVRLSGGGAGGWRIIQNPNQSVLVKNLPGNTFGSVWTPRESIRDWSCVASSADGSRLVAGVVGGQLYTSADSGATWTPRESNRIWFFAASSADGTKLIAGEEYIGQLYTSADSGATWTARETTRSWNSAASSADGSKLVAVVVDGRIYTSSDSGVSWTERDSDRPWISVASSADGSKLVAGVFGGPLYTSTDSGVTWTPHGYSGYWPSVASSADGSKLVAVDNGNMSGGFIYTSTDSGETWTPRDSLRQWNSVATSADGSKLVAVETDSGQIYTSTDSGVTWTPRESNRDWSAVASSADGGKLVAVVGRNGGGPGGQIYTSLPTSTSGTTGYLLGEPNAAIELQYIGNGQFIPLSHEGTIIAY